MNEQREALRVLLENDIKRMKRENAELMARMVKHLTVVAILLILLIFSEFYIYANYVVNK
jgi:hypothetical protein